MNDDYMNDPELCKRFPDEATRKAVACYLKAKYQAVEGCGSSTYIPSMDGKKKKKEANAAK